MRSSSGEEKHRKLRPRLLSHFLPDRRDLRDVERRRWRSSRLPDGGDQRARLMRALHHLYRDYRRVCGGCTDHGVPEEQVARSHEFDSLSISTAGGGSSGGVFGVGDCRVVQRQRRCQTLPVNQVLLGLAAGAEVWIDAPVALELRLPRVQAMLHQVMTACPFVTDPVEALAELRAARFATAECVEYLNEVRVIRGTAVAENSSAVMPPSLRQPPPPTPPPPPLPNSLATKAASANAASVLARRLASGLAALRADISECSTRVAAFASSVIASAVGAAAQSDALARSCRRLKRDARGARARQLERQVAELRARCRDEERQKRTAFNELQEQLGSVRVFARCRRGPGEQVVATSGPQTLRVLTGGRAETFQFDGVFNASIVAPIPACGGRSRQQQPGSGSNANDGHPDPDTQQLTDAPSNSADSDDNRLFDELRPLVASFLDGYNVCFIAYGGEASGKTHTLHGPSGDAHSGLVYRSLAAALVEARHRADTWLLELSTGCLEIYNDAMVDLGCQVGGRGPRRLPSGCLDGGLPALFDTLSHVGVSSEAEALDAIRMTVGRRRVARTALNPQSSRSHLLHLLRVRGRSLLHEGERVCAFLGMMDLAGAENVVKAATADNPTRAAEAGHINRSLASFNRLFLNLRRCSGTRGVATFRDSRLTQLMKPFVTDHGKCCIIVTLRTDRQSLSASLSSLRFGRDARQVMLGKAKRQLV